MSAELQGFVAPIWMTFRQALELNVHVRKGEKGSLVVFANAITRTDREDKTGEDIERGIPYMKGYTVFNVEQIEGLPEIYYAKAQAMLNSFARIDRAEKFFASMNATIQHGGNRAYYAQELDDVQMPDFGAFKDAESYYGTLEHEIVHNAASHGAMPAMRPRNSSPSWAAPFSAPTSISTTSHTKKAPLISRLGWKF